MLSHPSFYPGKMSPDRLIIRMLNDRTPRPVKLSRDRKKIKNKETNNEDQKIQQKTYLKQGNYCSPGQPPDDESCWRRSHEDRSLYRYDHG
jgi:hypothetical protein